MKNHRACILTQTPSRFVVNGPIHNIPVLVFFIEYLYFVIADNYRNSYKTLKTQNYTKV